jgi:hypothetical protein
MEYAARPVGAAIVVPQNDAAGFYHLKRLLGIAFNVRPGMRSVDENQIASTLIWTVIERLAVPVELYNLVLDIRARVYERLEGRFLESIGLVLRAVVGAAAISVEMFRVQRKGDHFCARRGVSRPKIRGAPRAGAEFEHHGRLPGKHRENPRLVVGRCTHNGSLAYADERHLRGDGMAEFWRRRRKHPIHRLCGNSAQCPGFPAALFALGSPIGIPVVGNDFDRNPFDQDNGYQDPLEWRRREGHLLYSTSRLMVSHARCQRPGRCQMP